MTRQASNLSAKAQQELAELNRARADYRLVERIKRLESVEELFYQRIKELTHRIEELEHALSSAKLVRSGTEPPRPSDLSATTARLRFGDPA